MSKKEPKESADSLAPSVILVSEKEIEENIKNDPTGSMTLLLEKNQALEKRVSLLESRLEAVDHYTARMAAQANQRRRPRA